MATEQSNQGDEHSKEEEATEQGNQEEEIA